ncbi:HEAT repeat domain-containing protein [Kitasatospora sp. GAS1066B]|uniref:HEAT repeat domain-containing protein n=1 Tax=Kitasatospora sp. GAS1066B TaxID=3156271 RepID=UPI0035151D19
MSTDTHTLVDQALAAARLALETDDDDRWHDYHTLLHQASAEPTAALPLGLALLGAPDPIDRAAGCDLLKDVCDRHDAARPEALTALLALAQGEAEGRVLSSLAGALGRTQDRRAAPVLVGLARHPDAEVRFHVAVNFAVALGDRAEGPELEALLALTRDADPDVRNWATFELGSVAELDSPEIRAALWERTTDEYPDARAEGVNGLARRHDPRAVPLLAELLADPAGEHTLSLGAAEILGAPELLSVLREFEPGDSWVEAAVRSCDPEQRAQLACRAWELVGALDRLRPELDAAVSMPRFDYELRLTGAPPELAYDIGALLARADGDPTRAADLVIADLVIGDLAVSDRGAAAA